MKTLCKEQPGLFTGSVLTPTDTSSRKSHQQFPLKPEASPLSTLLLRMLLSFPEKIDCVATLKHHLSPPKTLNLSDKY